MGQLRQAEHSQASALGRAGLALRTVVVALTAALLVIGGLALGSLLAEPDSKEIVVQSGETIWSIASRFEGGPNTATVVNDIVALNSLGSENIVAGQTLRLPSY